MRYCENETVEVYETSGENLGLLLIEAAGLVHSKGDAYVKVETQYDSEAGYIVTAYVHR